MRLFLPAIVALIVGLAGGLGVALFDLGRDTAHLEVGLTEAEVDASQGVAKAEVVGGLLYDFDCMEMGTTGRHNFVIRSTGTKPLELNVAHTTCKCTVGTLDRGVVPPGESVDVQMEWTPPHFTDSFRQKATLTTNDPDQPEIVLEIVGRVDIAVRARPSTISLGEVPANESHTVSTSVYCFRDVDFEITGQQYLRPLTAEHFRTEIRPLTEEEVAELVGATSGYRVEVTLEPGMPLGAFQQMLELTTNLENIQPVQITLEGELVGDFTLFGGPALDASHNLVSLDLVRSGQGRTETVYVIVKGAHREEVDLRVAEIDPAEVLTATISPPADLGAGTNDRYELQITIPPDAPSINRMGGTGGSLGTILIETGHPSSPQLILRVRFAVEG